MRRVMVRYRVRPEQVAANEELVRAVYAELDRARPDGFRYATFKLDDAPPGTPVVGRARGCDRNELSPSRNRR